MKPPFSQNRFDAVREALIFQAQDFLTRASVPLMYERRPHHPIPWGTCTFFSIRNRSFLVTAGHLFDSVSGIDFDPYLLVIPTSFSTSEYLVLGNFNITRPKNALIDVAVLELTSIDVVNELRKYWSFVTLDNVSLEWPVGEVWIVGYPGKRTKVRKGNIEIRPLHIITDRLLPTPSRADPPVDPALDLFLHYGRWANVYGKGKRNAPGALGISGASLWSYTGANPLLPDWSIEQNFKIVSVQSSWYNGRYIRSKMWWAVAKTFASIDSQMAQTIHDMFGS